MPCHKCVQDGAYDDFAFAMNTLYLQHNPLTQWVMRAA